MKSRIYFLDNLRTFLIFLVVVLHAGIVYEPILEYNWIVSDPAKNSSIGLIRMYLDLFIMFTMFYISGYFIPASLKGKDDKTFVWSKFKRIMIPWIVAVFTLIPLYKVIFLYSRGLPQEAWYTYFHFFRRLGGNPGYFADSPMQSWLWFLPVLFVFQIAYMLLSKTKLFKIQISMRNAVLLTIGIGIGYGMIISGFDLSGWFHSPLLHFQRERLLTYFMVFLLGSLSYKQKVFESENKNKKLYLWANVGLTLSLSVFTVVALNLFFNMIEPGRNYFFVSPIVDRLAYYTSMITSMMGFLYILLYVFRYNFNKTSPLLNELNKNSYGVYINHIPVIGIVAMLLLNIDMPVMVKYLVLVVLSYIFTNGLISVYRLILQKTLSKSLVRKLVLLGSLLLTITIYAKQIDFSTTKIKEPEIQSEKTAPGLNIQNAVIENNQQAIIAHIAAGTDLNQKEPSGGSTALITASLFGRTEIARLLVEAGANVNIQNNDGSTALHTAAFFCQPEIVSLLLENGADRSIRNNSGSTALESVQVPFELVKPYYEYFQNTLGPLGLELDFENLQRIRPQIAEQLKNAPAK